MSCYVTTCTRPADTVFDLDPERRGGPDSFGTEVPVCQTHFDALQAEGSEWIYDRFDGNDQVAVGADGIAALNEWKITSNLSVLQNKYRHTSDTLPRRDLLTLTFEQLGSQARKSVEFYASQDELKTLIASLQRHVR